jgi:parvulin-like peptidyl-prolyl isomerase
MVNSNIGNSPPPIEEQNKQRFLKGILIASVMIVLVYLIGSAIINRPTPYAQIFNVKISKEEFDEAYERSKSLAIFQYGRMYESFEPYINFTDDTWRRIILFEFAKKDGLSVSDEEVIEYISSYPDFHRQGIFDAFYYKTIVRNRYLTTPTNFEQGIRELLLINKMSTQYKNETDLSMAEIQNEFVRQNSKLSFDYINIPYADLVPSDTITEADIETHFKNNRNDFVIPESIKVQYVKMDFPPEGGIQKEVETKYKAIALYNEYIKNQNLKASVNKINTTTDYKVETSDFFGKDNPEDFIKWTPQVIKQVFELQPNQLSQPIELDDGYIIFKLIDHRGPRLAELEDVRPIIQKELEDERFPELARHKSDDLFLKIQSEIPKINPEDLIITSDSTDDEPETAETASPFSINIAPLTNLNDLLGSDGESASQNSSQPPATDNIPFDMNSVLNMASGINDSEEQRISILEKAFERIGYTEIGTISIPEVSLKQAVNILNLKNAFKPQIFELKQNQLNSLLPPLETHQGIAFVYPKTLNRISADDFDEKDSETVNRYRRELLDEAFEEYVDELIEQADLRYLP